MQSDQELSEEFSRKAGAPLNIQTTPAKDDYVALVVHGATLQLTRSDHVRLFGDDRRMGLAANMLKELGYRVRSIKMRYGSQLIVQRRGDVRDIDEIEPPAEWSGG